MASLTQSLALRRVGSGHFCPIPPLWRRRGMSGVPPILTQICAGAAKIFMCHERTLVDDGRTSCPASSSRAAVCSRGATETEGEITVRRAEGSVHRSRRRIERRLNQPSRISLLVVQSLIPRRISARRRKRESASASN